jgi:hypothetical protein
LALIVVCLPEMDAYQRPKGLKATAVLMSITNAFGWFIVDWSRPYAITTFCLFTIIIMAGYFVIWLYWEGHNWARILVLLTCVLCLYNLRYFSHGRMVVRLMIGSEALLAVFLLFWLNTPKVKAFFRAPEKSASTADTD